MPDGTFNKGAPPTDVMGGLHLAAPAAALCDVRAAARKIAAHALAERGFTLQTAPDDHWVGSLTLPRSDTTLAVQVRLPPAFPDTLPKVAIIPDSLPKPVAHVELNGTVCVAPSANVLVDADRPEALIAEALCRAAEVLDRGLLGESDADFDAEFQAYWATTVGTPVLSLCNADGPARSIEVFELTGGSKLIDQSWMVADSTEDAEAWARNVNAKITRIRSGLFVPVSASIPLARPNQVTTVSEIARLITGNGTAAGRRLFSNAIERAEYPQMVVVSMPEAPPGAGRRLAAVAIPRPAPEALEMAARGFRRGRAPAVRILSRIAQSAVDRISLTRLDHAYLTARGGAAKLLAQATVTIVGTGAVGSEIARNLAALGVGHLRIVDHDVLNPENVHRHVLGMESTGYPKTAALSVKLRASFPHLDIDCRVSGVEELLENEPAFLLQTDLIVLATGEETLERRLNRLLQDGPPRLHAWLEPLGIAGHAFACGRHDDTGQPGPVSACFECLYRPDNLFGLVNRTALTAPGQEIRRSLAGCAGTFSPFSALDARRTAIDAAELAARVLTRDAVMPTLVSWRGMHSGFEAIDYRLSARAAQIQPGARVEISGGDLSRDVCPVCGVHPRPTASALAVGGDTETAP